MTAEELRRTVQEAAPPAGLPLPVEALWWEAHGDWNRAHRMVDELTTPEGAWVHAYVHRCEGDLGNAAYWYRQAGRPANRLGLQEEWAQIVDALLMTAGK
jgi:hypothetical protein